MSEVSSKFGTVFTGATPGSFGPLGAKGASVTGWTPAQLWQPGILVIVKFPGLSKVNDMDVVLDGAEPSPGTDVVVEEPVGRYGLSVDPSVMLLVDEVVVLVCEGKGVGGLRYGFV